MTAGYRRVGLMSDGWSLADVTVAGTARERFVGLRGRFNDSVLFRTRSVHTFTMTRPIAVAQIGPDGLVLRVDVVQPRRFVTAPRPVWMLETEALSDAPSVRSWLTVVPSSGNARNTHPLWNADWESWRRQ